HRALHVEHGPADDVLGGDELDHLALPAQLLVDGAGDDRVGLGGGRGEVAGVEQGGRHGPPHPPILTSAPPSTGSATPVMKSASSEARKSAALATSHAVPMRWRSGTRALRIATTSSRLLPHTRARVSTAIGVFMRPGRMTLARMPYSAFWMASC